MHKLRCNDGVFLLILVAAAVVLLIGQGRAQILRTNRDTTVFIAPTREVLRPLRLAQRAIENRDFEKASQLLGEILSDQNTQDFLIADGKQWGHAVSLRQSALSLLGSLTWDQQETYRKKYSAKSQRILDAAVQEQDFQAIQAVASQYFYTSAGQQATMLTGHYQLSQGRSAMAAATFDRLLAVPKSREQFDPELTMLSAIAHALSGADGVAGERLDSLRQSGFREVEFYGKSVPLFSNGDDPAKWLTALIGSSPLRSQPAVEQWLMFRGTPSRVSESLPGFPLYSPRWSARTLANPLTQDLLDQDFQLMTRNEVAPLPRSHALTVGNSVVVRSVDRLVSYDAETGRRQWFYPADALPAIPPGDRGNHQGDVERQRRDRFAAGNEDIDPDRIRERTWVDSVYGQISSDDRHVFLIPNPGMASDRGDWARYHSDRFSDPTDLRKTNELVCLDAARQGLVRWKVGGKSGYDDPELAGMFFLGPPLPIDGTLYAIAMRLQSIRLVAIDAQTGSLQWQSMLATTEDGIPIEHDKMRRLAGAVPAEMQGVLVCPTGQNALVAVDRNTRSLIWGHQFSRPKMTNTTIDNVLQYDRNWRDTFAMIDGDTVVYTPLQSRSVICLNLRTGEKVAGEKRESVEIRRGKSLYVDSIQDNRLIMVGAQEVRAVELSSGKETHRTTFEKYGTLSGRGYTSGRHHYLPTSSDRVIKIDLDSLQIVDSVLIERAAGNLLPWKNDVISVGADHVSVYPRDEAGERMLAASQQQSDLVQQADASEHGRLAIIAQLQLQKRQYHDAATTISRAYDLFPNSNYARILVQSLKELIYTDFETANEIFERYQPLFGQQDLRRLLQGKVNGLIKSGRTRQAFETLIEIANTIDLTAQRDAASQAGIDPEEQVVVECDEVDIAQAAYRNPSAAKITMAFEDWLRSGFFRLQQGLDESTRQEFSELVAAHLNAFAGDSASSLYQRTSLFPPAMSTSAWKVGLAERLVEDRQWIRAANLIQQVDVDVAAGANAGSGSDLDTALNQRRVLVMARLALEERDAANAIALLDSLSGDGGTEALEAMESTAKSVRQLRRQADAVVAQSAEKASAPGYYEALRELTGSPVGPQSLPKPVQWQRSVKSVDPTSTSYVSLVRHRCEIRETDRPAIREHLYHYDVQGQHESYASLTIRDSLGRLARSVKFDFLSESDGVSRGTAGKIFCHDSVFLFCIGNRMIAMDWFKLCRGNDPVIWSTELSSGTFTRNVFGGPRASGICFIEGNELHCVCPLTGRTRWIRDQVLDRSTIREGGDEVTIWNDSRRVYETFAKATGQRLAAGKIPVGAGSTFGSGDQLQLFTAPRRDRFGATTDGGQTDKGSVETADEDSSAPFEPFGEQMVYNSIEMQLFDFAKQEFVWSRTFPFPTAFELVDQREIAVLTVEGELSMLDLETGEPKYRIVDQSIGGLPLSGVHAHHFADKTVFIANVSTTVPSSIKLDDVKVNLNRVHPWGLLNNGLMFAVDRTTKKLAWSKPVPVERYQELDGVPWHSPFSFLARLCLYETSPRTQRVQVAMVDLNSGRLASNELLVAAISNGVSVNVECQPKAVVESDAEEGDGKAGKAVDSQMIRLSLAAAEYSILLSDELSEVVSTADLQNDAAVKPFVGEEVSGDTEPEDIPLVFSLDTLREKAKAAEQALEASRTREAALFAEEAAGRSE